MLLNFRSFIKINAFADVLLNVFGVESGKLFHNRITI